MRGGGTRQLTNPLNTSRHRHPPLIVGWQDKIWQNWRPGPKIVGPIGTQGEQVC